MNNHQNDDHSFVLRHYEGLARFARELAAVKPLNQTAAPEVPEPEFQRELPPPELQPEEQDEENRSQSEGEAFRTKS